MIVQKIESPRIKNKTLFPDFTTVIEHFFNIIIPTIIDNIFNGRLRKNRKIRAGIPLSFE